VTVFDSTTILSPMFPVIPPPCSVAFEGYAVRKFVALVRLLHMYLTNRRR